MFIPLEAIGRCRYLQSTHAPQLTAANLANMPKGTLTLNNESAAWAKIDIQGPAAQTILARKCDIVICALGGRDSVRAGLGNDLSKGHLVWARGLKIVSQPECVELAGKSPWPGFCS